MTTPSDSAGATAVAVAPRLSTSNATRDDLLANFAEEIDLKSGSCGRLSQLTDQLSTLRQRLKHPDIEFEKNPRRDLELLVSAAHDLRQPVAAIMASSELLAEEPDASGQKELIDTIRSLCIFALRLLDDTLSLAEMESGGVELYTGTTTLSPIVELIVSMNAPLAARKNINISLAEEGEALPVLVDPLRMCEVFNNLIDNAVKYCQPGARIEVRISRVEDTVRVAVLDNGPGISPADLKTLFTPFQKSHARARSEVPGTGLGLAITKHIVELHRGRISVETEVGKGTTFIVSLPAKNVPKKS